MNTAKVKAERQQAIYDACHQYRTINSSSKAATGLKFMGKKYWRIVLIVIGTLVTVATTSSYLSGSKAGVPDKNEQYLIGIHIGKMLLSETEKDGALTIMFTFDKNNQYYSNRIRGLLDQLKMQTSIKTIYAVSEGVYDDEEGNLNQAIEYGIDNLVHQKSTLVIVGIGSVAYQRPSRKVAKFIKRRGKIILIGKCAQNEPMVKLAKAGYLTVITEFAGKNSNKASTISDVKDKYHVISG